LNFFERYSQVCREKNLDPCSQTVADMFGVSKGTICAWNTRNTFPKGETVAAIAVAFGVSADYLLGISEIKEPPSISLTPEEVELVLKYRSLDNDGKIVIRSAFIQETRRTKGE